MNLFELVFLINEIYISFEKIANHKLLEFNNDNFCFSIYVFKATSIIVLYVFINRRFIIINTFDVTIFFSLGAWRNLKLLTLLKFILFDLDFILLINNLILLS